MTGNFLSDLSRDIGQLFSTGENHDLIIQAGEGQNTKEFFTHSLILSARSTYFKTALSKEWARKENGIIIFKKPNISPEIIELILEYLYTGIVNFDKQNCEQLLNLLTATDELNLKKLNDSIQTYLTNNRKEFLDNNLIEVLQIVFQHETCEHLRKHCIYTICESPKILFESPKFILIDEDLIILFLKQGRLGIEEIDIWEYVLEWALARMSTQHNVYNLWTSSNFDELKTILYNLIPHISWFQIPAEVFRKRISKFEPIFPKQLYKDIIKHHSTSTTSSSTIILSQRSNIIANSILVDKSHLYILASWIDKKDKSFYCFMNTPYSFELLYRASRDGFEASKFHELCDDKGSTVMISKLEGNGKLIGGYNPLSWKSCDGWGASSDSFLFSFTKKENFISRVNHSRYAISYNPDYGPAFGGWDLIIKHDKIIGYNVGKYLNLNHIIDFNRRYTLEDYEIFKIKKL